MVITWVPASREINIKAAHVFSFGLLFSLKPLCGSGKSIVGPLNQLPAFLGWFGACTRGPEALGPDSVSQVRLSELAKSPQILKIDSL